MENTKWIIWSIEHGAWWRPESRGYCVELAGAGVYSYEEAVKIVTGANFIFTLLTPQTYDPKLNTPHEAMILVTPQLALQINVLKE